MEPADCRGVISVRLIKLVRLLRLLKLGRMFRVPNLLHQLETTMTIDYMQLKLCKYIAMVAIFTHWLACLMFLSASYSDLLMDNSAEHCTWVDDFSDRWGELSGPSEKYIASVYFAAATITKLGAGDVVPSSTAETPLIVSVLMQILIPAACCAFYAYVIGGVLALLSAMHAEKEAFMTELDGLNHFMRYRNLPSPLRAKLRDFLHFRWRERRLRGIDIDDLDLTPSLSTAIYHFTHVPILKSLPPFRGIIDDFLTTLCDRMSVCMFSSQDMIIRCCIQLAAPEMLWGGGDRISVIIIRCKCISQFLYETSSILQPWQANTCNAHLGTRNSHEGR